MSVPFLTLADGLPPAYTKCATNTLAKGEPVRFTYLFVFFVLVVNSVILDAFCYARILNYMRKNSVRVMVVATTVAERAKAHNVVTATSSLLVWLITTFAMAPSLILLLKSPAQASAQDTVTLINYQV